jgi:uncharacterized membrane protein
MSSELEKIVGPRMPADELKANRMRYIIPTLLFVAAAVLLIISIQRRGGGSSSMRRSIRPVSTSPPT